MSTALIFSGQGAQSVGMGKDLAEKYPVCAELYAKADDVIGYELSKICFEGPDEELTKSNHCQPAIFVTSVACAKALEAESAAPEAIAMAGLSLGEWTALHMAGVLSFEDTVKVLEARGRFMQEACDEQAGGMVSIIGLAREQLDAICAETGVTVANLNSSAQTVLSGAKAGIEQAEALATEAGAKRAIILNVAGAFHSPLMASAATKLDEVLAGITFNEPTVPVLSNVKGEPHAGADAIRANMISQVTDSVLWLSCVEWLQAQGVDRYVECGPGKVLTGLIKRIAKGATLDNVNDVVSVEKALQSG
ncbi:MAG: ACP S-malonyltransferase [Kiritimatiellia bacterium]|jgi:[acyl-carrier-protein] S-malonyltransferase|nr:ACP S-malonyltransferase [Kiritimatiellia bacterium]MDP6810545.1 ACP S-malonyltransferase [Kiritimatiellia bacterium]MDP7024939.1 ACP S-malonyltransferase [Kiritimatiellia bacterium]